MDRGAIGLLVVNLSLADPRSPSLAVRNGIAKLVRRGALLVAATGNRDANGGTRLRYPARLPHVIAVGDMEEQARLPGPELDLLAPGGSLWTPTVGQVWKPIGPAQTSYATPLVSGAAAAVWGAHPDGSALTAQQVGWLLRSTARRARRAGRGAAASGRSTSAPPCASPSGSPPTTSLEPNDSATEASSGGALAAPRLRQEPARDAASSARRTTPRTGGRSASPAAARSAGRSAASVHSSVVQGPKGLAYVRITTTRPQAAYTLKVRAGRNC